MSKGLCPFCPAIDRKRSTSGAAMEGQRAEVRHVNITLVTGISLALSAIAKEVCSLIV